MRRICLCHVGPDEPGSERQVKARFKEKRRSIAAVSGLRSGVVMGRRVAAKSNDTAPHTATDLPRSPKYPCAVQCRPVSSRANNDSRRNLASPSRGFRRLELEAGHVGIGTSLTPPFSRPRPIRPLQHQQSSRSWRAVGGRCTGTR